ncbi:MAG TPA: hypothetical protein VE267_14895 [Bradyrhizobium sp.]|nr:hypothetical protein [Bradyrhizobium sp.]
MSKTSTKIVITLIAVLAAPAASYAKMAGQAGTGNLAISGIAAGPANPGIVANPSGIGNASRLAPLPQPHIAPPVIPKFK